MDREKLVSTEVGLLLYAPGVVIVQYYVMLTFFLLDCNEKSERLHNIKESRP